MKELCFNPPTPPNICPKLVVHTPGPRELISFIYKRPDQPAGTYSNEQWASVPLVCFRLIIHLVTKKKLRISSSFYLWAKRSLPTKDAHKAGWCVTKYYDFVTKANIVLPMATAVAKGR